MGLSCIHWAICPGLTLESIFHSLGLGIHGPHDKAVVNVELTLFFCVKQFNCHFYKSSISCFFGFKIYLSPYQKRVNFGKHQVP